MWPCIFGRYHSTHYRAPPTMDPYYLGPLYHFPPSSPCCKPYWTPWFFSNMPGTHGLGPFHWPFPLPRTLFLQISTWLTSCYILMNFSLVTRLKNRNAHLPFHPVLIFHFSPILVEWEILLLHVVLAGVLGWGWLEGPNGFRHMAGSNFWLPDGSSVGTVGKGLCSPPCGLSI